MTLKQANIYLHVQVCEGRKTFICYLVGVNVLGHTHSHTHRDISVGCQRLGLRT
jgi:hypothetical protein